MPTDGWRPRGVRAGAGGARVRAPLHRRAARESVLPAAGRPEGGAWRAGAPGTAAAWAVGWLLLLLGGLCSVPAQAQDQRWVEVVTDAGQTAALSPPAGVTPPGDLNAGLDPQGWLYIELRLNTPARVELIGGDCGSACSTMLHTGGTASVTLSMVCETAATQTSATWVRVPCAAFDVAPAQGGVMETRWVRVTGWSPSVGHTLYGAYRTSGLGIQITAY